MAHLRLVEPSIDTYGSRRAWKRDRRERQRGPALGVVALGSVAILVAVVLLVQLFSGVAAFGG
jgi:hypothetical protein